MAYIVGVDTGGTFTDCVVMTGDGAVVSGKAPTTPGELERGVLASVTVAAEQLGLDLATLLQGSDSFLLGSTQGINTLLTRAGSRVGLITTRGFEDTLEVARAVGRVAALTETEFKHISSTKKPQPLVPRWLVKGVEERVDCFGDVVIALREDDVREAVQAFLREDVKAVVVSLLWSFLNGVHERRVRDIINALAPDLPVSLSSEVCPSLGEYIRASTCVINGYIFDRVQTFHRGLAQSLHTNGLKSPLRTLSSAGGAARWDLVHPVYTVNSGPAAGMIASVWHAQLLGLENVITTDVGGTSFDIGIIRKGKYASERGRFLPPTVERYHVQAPTIDIISIGAGGGTIAWIDPVTHLLKVGPQSAGAKPGPACYGAGGRQATVTDANLVLGRVDPDYFLDGRMHLHLDLAKEALSKVGEPLGLDAVEAAASIIELADQAMADVIIKNLYLRGYDPSEFTALLFGGAGPLHGQSYSRRAGLTKGVALSLASVWSALGACVSDIRQVFSLSKPLAMPADIGPYNDAFEGLESRAREFATSEGFKDVRLDYKVHMRYGTTEHDIILEQVPPRVQSGAELEQLETIFLEKYREVFGQESTMPGFWVEISSFVLEASVPLPTPKLHEYALGTHDCSSAKWSTRPVFFNGGFLPTAIYDSRELMAGNVVSGPAVVQCPYTTVLVPPETTCTVDRYLNYHLEWSD